MNALKVAYLANILILIPVAIPTLLRTLDVAEGKFAESEGFRVLVGSLWTAILLCSFGGLFAPERFVPVLVMQVIYKSLWLGLYVVPRLLSHRAGEVPLGITASFFAIVLIWPWIIPWRQLWATPGQ